MQLHPHLRALRDDDTPQRAAQQALFRALAEWRAAAGAGVLDAELEAMAGGAPLAGLPLLSALFDGGETSARSLLNDLVTTLSAALAEAPLAQVPLRHFCDGTLATLLIARSGSVTLTVSALDGAAFARQAAAKSVSFPPNQSWEHVLAGQASGEWIDWHGVSGGQVRLETRPIELAPGSVVVRDSERRALRLNRIDGCLVTLRLQRRRADSVVTREYRLEDGALLHQAASNPRDSRLELAAALLGRMGRVDAAPLLAALAVEQGSRAVRWQVLRECLALDTAAGFGALSAIARAPDDPLAVAAGALRAQLIERHPVLAELEPCPA